MAITWEQSLSVGIMEIDDQHREFIRLLAKLDSIIRNDKVAEHLDPIIAELHDYVKFHFGTEERHFDEFGCYPNADAHKAAHRGFAERLGEMKYRFLHDRKALSAELAQVMYDWLIEHIARMDREYIDCFKKSGL